MRQKVVPAYHDPQNSVDLLDADRLNEFGDTYCVAPAIPLSDVKWHWERYKNDQNTQCEKGD